MNKQYVALLLVASMVCSYGCKRDVMAPSPSVPVDGRQKFVGTYDVYDTFGNWRYEMEISLHPGIANIDSVYVENWGDEFNLFIQHDDGNTSNYLNLNGQFGIQDHEGNRWALFEEYDSLFMNGYLMNDTLRMSYLKDNIAFYVADGVPYFRQSYREYAVKREEE
ncbi:MAG: hypothetical protein M9900_14060 [Flavobacteriales bacterium]|nr:hypothetical protein [Flavobacteriales bacterium]